MSSKQSYRHVAAILIIGLLIAGCAGAQEAGPEEITIDHLNLFPEGIEYDDQAGYYLLSSVTEGTIHAVSDDGTLEPFIEDGELLATGGIEIDHLNNRLIVTNSIPGGPVGMLGAYDLETGDRDFMTDLASLFPSEGHLINDVAVDASGNAYATDSFAPVIYRVDMDGNASVFLEDPALMFINGIVAHPDGYLLLGAFQNQLFKVPLDDPQVMPIELPEDVIFDITDGMIFHPDGTLVMVTFPGSVIYRLSSEDDWNSTNLEAISTGHDAGWGTTVASRGQDVYVIYSHLNYLQENLGDVETFEIVRVEFEDN